MMCISCYKMFRGRFKLNEVLFWQHDYLRLLHSCLPPDFHYLVMLHSVHISIRIINVKR